MKESMFGMIHKTKTTEKPEKIVLNLEDQSDIEPDKVKHGAVRKHLKDDKL